MPRNLFTILFVAITLIASAAFAQDTTGGSVWTPVLTAVGALLSTVATVLIGILMVWLKKKL